MVNARKFILSVLSVVCSLSLLATTATAEDVPEKAKWEEPRSVTIKQDTGNLVYWVEPGPRKLSKEVFGTPKDPKRTVDEMLEEAKEGVTEFPDGAPGPVLQLLKDMPVLVSAPLKHRETNKKGTEYSVYSDPVPSSSSGTPLSFNPEKNGYFQVKLTDRVKNDLKGGPGNTHDKASFISEFHDPDGNHYRIVLDHLVQPPMPRYKTGNGVLLDRELHGNEGTGTPLMPRQYTHAAFWGMGDIYINGEYRGRRLTHLMTTEVVRDKDYNLALDEELPLDSDELHVSEQPHHTHLMIAPVEPYKPMPVLGSLFGLGPTAPRHAPVPTEYELENGNKQGVIHMMFEQDEITNSQNVQFEERFMP